MDNLFALDADLHFARICVANIDNHPFSNYTNIKCQNLFNFTEEPIRW